MMSMKTVLVFLLGAGVGSVGMYLGVKRHFETLADEEIESVKEYYKSDLVKELKKGAKTEEIDPEMPENEENTDKNDPTDPSKEPDYQGIIQKLNYGEYSKKEKAAEEKTDKPTKKQGPFVISGDEFAGDLRHEKITLTYFEDDGVFFDEAEAEIISEGMELVGEENLGRFGEYEEDVLYVRNNDNRTDYEVLLEHMAYAESEYVEREYEDD